MMADSELEKTIEVFNKSTSSKVILNALITIRKKVDWPRHRANVAILRQRGTLKRLLWILSINTNKSCIDTTLSILGNCLMAKECTSEMVGDHNIFSLLCILLEKYPNDDSIKGRSLRIVGNMCQHSDQWTGFIINRKELLVTTAVDIVRKASLDALPDSEKLSEATIITALRALRELLNCNTIIKLVEDYGTLKAVGALFIKYSTLWQVEKQNEKLLLDIVRVIHEYSKYKNYQSILDMRATERGDSLLHLASVLLLTPRRIVKIVMNFIRCCRLKSELPIPEICVKFMNVLKDRSLVKELPGHYNEYLKCLCYLLDHPANRNSERCGMALPLLIKVLREFEVPSNNIVECCILLFYTMSKFRYDTALMMVQLKNDIVPLLVDKLSWLVGPPDVFSVSHVCEKKRKYKFGAMGGPQSKKRCIQGDVVKDCVRRAASSSDEDREVALDTLRYNRSPSPYSSSSDGDSGRTFSTCSSPLLSFGPDSDSDNYSPVCSDASESEYGAAAPVSMSDESCDSNDEIGIFGATPGAATAALSDAMKAGLKGEIVKLLKVYVKTGPSVLVNTDLLVQLTKCAAAEKDDLKNTLCGLLRNHETLIPLLQTEFVQTICSIDDDIPNRECCYRCARWSGIATSFLDSISQAAESAMGKGDIAHALMTGPADAKRRLVLILPYVVRNRSILSKLMLNCGGLDTLIDLFRGDNEQDNRRTLRVLCHMATHRLLIANPRDATCERAARPSTAAAVAAYQCPRSCANVVSFLLDDGSAVEADRDFLCAKSEFFNGLLNGHFKERGERRVGLSKVDGHSLRCLLYLLHHVDDPAETRDVDLDLDTLLDVIALCDRFLLVDLCVLLTDCVEQFKMSTETVPAIYNWSVESGTNLLRVESVAFALVMKMDERQRFRMFETLFGLGYKERLLADIQNLLVRFLTLSGIQQRMRDAACEGRRSRS